MSLHAASVPVFAQLLRALDAILVKTSAYAASKNITPEVMLGLRLAPDMFAFARQVQVACDFAKNTSGRLAGAELPKFEDTEKTFEELHARIAKTLAYIEGLPAAAFNGAESRTIQFPMRGNPHTMQGRDYLNSFALPHFFFHVNASYAILRSNGVDIGKGDYMGAVAGLTVL